jgi:DNA polymerase-3 subunit delta'
VLELTHPDLHWFIPIPRPKASESDKQIEEAKEMIGELIETRRSNPLYTRPDGLAAHGVASARLLLRSASLSAVLEGFRVFIIGDADRLVPQEANQEAANSLLKFLEEPPVRSLIVLTAPDPGRVLPTIRSRAATVRLAPLPADQVRQFLSKELPEPLSSTELERRVHESNGAIGAAIQADESRTARREAARQLFGAIKGAPAERFERALKQFPAQARGEFTSLLDTMLDAVRDATRAATGHAPLEGVLEPLARCKDPERLVQALTKIEAARQTAQGNVNPQLLLAALTQDLAEVL